MITVQRGLRAYNLTLNEAVDLARNRPLWRLMYVWRCALLVVHARKEEEDKNEPKYYSLFVLECIDLAVLCNILHN